jgi:hypothetical protein
MDEESSPWGRRPRFLHVDVRTVRQVNQASSLAASRSEWLRGFWIVPSAPVHYGFLGNHSRPQTGGRTDQC